MTTFIFLHFISPEWYTAPCALLACLYERVDACACIHISRLTNTAQCQRQITLRIVGYPFSSRLTATLNLCSIYLKLLVYVL